MEFSIIRGKAGRLILLGSAGSNSQGKVRFYPTIVGKSRSVCLLRLYAKMLFDWQGA